MSNLTSKLNLATARKAWVAVVGAAVEAGLVLKDGNASTTDILLIVAAGATALSVYQAKNKVK